MVNHTIKFRNLLKEDSPILHVWLQEPHVREFWDDGIRTIEQTQSYYYQENGVNRFIFFIDDNLAGYIQSYDVKLHDEYKRFFRENKKTIGVDFFIGNKKFLGKGFAKIIINQFIELYGNNPDRIIVDPDPFNSRAIHVYETCGFVKQETYTINNRSHLIMIRNESNDQFRLPPSGK